MTALAAPADQDARERVIRDLDVSIFLEAGAGAGKTSVLVARVVNLVRSGTPLSDIVAITFTEKAAGELRDRIRSELAVAGLRDSPLDVDAAPIQTIHAFCAGILRKHALVAGLHPDFRVLDQLQADLRFAHSWRTWLWGAGRREPGLQRLLELGLPLSELQQAADQLSRNRDLRGDFGDALEDDATDEQSERDAALSDVIPLLCRFLDADAAQRRRDGGLSYDDLLLETRDLLMRSRNVREALRERIRCLLIDEFQDTDPLQAQIALLIASEPDTDDWTQARPGAGRLVLAGDPKQSIYRFRRADIDVYEQVRDLFRASPETAQIVSLEVSFRARPALSAWHSRVLPRVLRPDEDFPRAQARWEASQPHRDESAGVGRPAVVAIPSNREFDRAAEAREAEARLLANLIEHMRQPDALLGLLPDADGPRSPGYRDVAILVRARTAAEFYTKALDRAGIPYHFDSGQGFYQQPEIRAVAQLLAALDDPSDEAAAIAVLKSPLRAASDAEIYEWRAGAEDSRLSAWTEEMESLRARIRGLNLPELIDQVIRVSGLLEAQAAGAAPSQMRQRQANLRMLVQRAAHFADDHGSALRPFVRWLTQRGARHLPESESATTEADDDAVRILTIHQAKGLEFPIVILPKLQDQPPQGSNFFVNRAHDRLEFSLGGERNRPTFRTPGYAAAQIRDRAYADAESRRMLYVAATRARDWLILPSFPAESLRSRDAFHSVLDEAAPGWTTPDTAADMLVLSPRVFDAAPRARPELRMIPLEDLRNRWQDWHTTAIAGGNATIETTAPSYAYKSSGTDEDDDSERSDSAFNPLDFGSAVHEALEIADFANLQVTRRRTVRAARRRLVPEELVLAHVERALATDVMQRAAQSSDIYRELPLNTIAAPSEDAPSVITNGIIDLLFQDDGRWILVDYKSNATADDVMVAAFAPQLQRYVEMLGAAGVNVVEAWLLFTSTGNAVSVPLD